MLPAIFNENLFDNFFNDDFYMPSVFGGKNDPLYGKHAKNVMKTDVRETDNSYELDIDLPGFKKEDVSLKLDSGYLTIRTAAAGTRFGDQSAFIVSLKRDTCSECRQTAYDEAQLEKRNGKWQYVLVQHIADGEIESL